MIAGIVDETIKQGDDIQYDEQYNPHHDFAIFGQGDPRGGGLQTMQEKMNMADDVNSSDSDEDMKKAASNDKKTKDNYEEVAMTSLDASIEAKLPSSSSNVSSNECLNKLPED
jgi:hypothetical protein